MLRQANVPGKIRDQPSCAEGAQTTLTTWKGLSPKHSTVYSLLRVLQISGYCELMLILGWSSDIAIFEAFLLLQVTLHQYSCKKHNKNKSYWFKKIELNWIWTCSGVSRYLFTPPEKYSHTKKSENGSSLINVGGFVTVPSSLLHNICVLYKLKLYVCKRYNSLSLTVTENYHFLLSGCVRTLQRKCCIRKINVIQTCKLGNPRLTFSIWCVFSCFFIILYGVVSI